MKISPWIVPALIVAFTLAGLGAARLLAIPTVEVDLTGDGAETAKSLDTITLVVDGVRCADTARAAASTLDGEQGIRHFVAFASYSRIEITFDPTVTGRDAIVAALEGPVYDPETGEFRFGMFEVAEEYEK